MSHQGELMSHKFGVIHPQGQNSCRNDSPPPDNGTPRGWSRITVGTLSGACTPVPAPYRPSIAPQAIRRAKRNVVNSCFHSVPLSLMTPAMFIRFFLLPPQPALAPGDLAFSFREPLSFRSSSPDDSRNEYSMPSPSRENSLLNRSY